MKVRASVKKRSADDKVVRRKGTHLRDQQEESQAQATPGVMACHG